MSYWPKNKDPYPILFVHIPKTAGLSIKQWYGHRYKKYYKCMHAGVQHPLIRSTAKQMPSFAVIRNPFDLVYSWYRYKRKMLDESRHKDPRELAIWNKGFNPWMEKYFTKVNRTVDKTSKGYNNMSPSFSQSSYLFFGNKQLIEHILRFESLSSDFEKIKQLVHTDIGLGYTNKTVIQNRDYRSVYSADSRNMVEQYYRHDLETFSYDF